MDPDEITPPQFKKSKDDDPSRDAAVNVIRGKLDALYQEEPDAKEEAAEVLIKPDKSLSKHQRFMKELTQSGKDTAEVQVAWHEYYESLSPDEQHEVWQEFYSEQAALKQKKKQEKEAAAKKRAADKKRDEPLPQPVRKKAPDTLKTQIISRVQAEAKENHHLRSLIFGLGMGTLVVFIFLFSFFNERFITPFIRPSQNVSATPIIVDPNNSGPTGPEPIIIIPKINVEAPVVYDVPTIEEKDIQTGLECGVVHYATTPNPGEKGNAVIFGHSSSNILNKGKFKFAFLLLKSLEKDDTFIIQKDGKRYVYKIFNKFVTSPKDFSVLGPTDREAIVTLITCDPPGTSTNRLIIQAEQIFPAPSANAASSVQQADTSEAQQLPSNSPSLWSRIFGG